MKFREGVLSQNSKRAPQRGHYYKIEKIIIAKILEGPGDLTSSGYRRLS